MLIEILMAGPTINTPHKYIVLKIHNRMTCKKSVMLGIYYKKSVQKCVVLKIHNGIIYI
jgi:hypothetical protein